MDKRKRKKFKCVYCGGYINYEGACLACGHKEDVALGKADGGWDGRACSKED